ncbi:MAG: hypothetical protein AAF293_13820 [Pseudomonadota bacterium]
MLIAAYTRLKGFIGRVTEVTGVVLALFAAYEMVIADRVAPHVTGGVWVCPSDDRPDYMQRTAFFDFLRENADSFVYLDFWLAPVEYDFPDRACLDQGSPVVGILDDGLRVLGTPVVYPDGATGPTPELIITSARIDIPQTARLTAQYGEEPIFGVTGMVYVEAGEVEMGFQEFSFSAAPYDAAVLKKRDCTRDYLAADGLLDRVHSYVFACLAQ